MWGGNFELRIGQIELSPGTSARCNQGNTYSGTADQVCGGGDGTWGETRLEVWRRADFPGGQLLTAAMDAQLQVGLAGRAQPRERRRLDERRPEGLSERVAHSLRWPRANGCRRAQLARLYLWCLHADRMVVHAGMAGGATNIVGSGHFIFRLSGPGLSAEAWDTTDGNTQWNSASSWPHVGCGSDLRFGA
jgi:hypothetical protein